jgi:serine protease Do
MLPGAGNLPGMRPVLMTERVTMRHSIFLASLVGIATVAGLAGTHPYTWPDPHLRLTQPAGAQERAPPIGFEDLVDRVKPAVIGVRAKVEKDDEDQEQSGHQGSPSDRLFPHFGTPKNNSDTPRRRRLTTSQGSGFFISADGYAVTTSHVVERGKAIEGNLDGGKTHAARLIGADPKTDVALLKVEGGDEFPFVRLAENAPRIGEWVVAVGNPFGLGGTVTAGIVSARARDLKMGTYNDFIQIDAPVNQGNSGGPTFDIRGNVIGVNSAIFSPTGGSVGIGFAIPAETVNTIVAELKDKGAVRRGWIGVQIQSVSSEIAEGFGLAQTEGALVVEPQANSPAAKAGISAGDVIASINGEAVKDDRDLMKRVGDMVPGTSVKLGLFRNGQGENVTITLGELPRARSEAPTRPDSGERPAASADPSHLGLKLATGGIGEGVIVTDVDPGGIAAERGLEIGDTILAVGRDAVKTPDDVKRMLSDTRRQGKRIAVMRVKSGDAMRYIAIPIG